MKKLILATGVLCLVMLASPAPASAHASFFLSLGLPLPSFGFFVGPPPAPVAYYPYYYPRRAYYAPTPYCHRYHRRPGYHRGYGYGY